MDLSKPDHNRRITDPGPQAEARRLSIEERLLIVEAKADRIPTIEAKIDANSEMTKNIVDLFKTMEAGVKVLGYVGRFAKWLAPIIALGVTVWTLFNGKPPTGG